MSKQDPGKGRPRTHKIKLMLSIDAVVAKDIDARAKQFGLSRSAYIEVLLRADLAKKPPFS